MRSESGARHSSELRNRMMSQLALSGSAHESLFADFLVTLWRVTLTFALGRPASTLSEVLWAIRGDMSSVLDLFRLGLLWRRRRGTSNALTPCV